MKDSQTVSSIADGLARLIREVRQLKGEVAQLHHSFRGFGKAAPDFNRVPRSIVLPPEDGGGDLARGQTDEPRSRIEMLRYEYGDNPNLEIPTRTLLAIAKELDGALRDIRAARLDIKAIADDSDLREDFKEWQRNQP